MIGPNPLSEGLVLVEAEVLATLNAFRQRGSYDTEAGGLLLGFRRGAHLHVTACTKPFPTDVRTRISFNRAVTGHDRIAYERWLASDERMDYVGEWHSHPEANAAPSSIDLYEWRKLLQNRPDALLFLVIGTGRDWYGIGAHSKIERVAMRRA